MTRTARKIITKRARTTPSKGGKAPEAKRRSRPATATKKASPRARRAVRKDEAERIPPIMQRPSDAMLWDINSVYGLIEALGGAEALGKVIPTRDHGNPTEHVLDWARNGWIPPGLHLRLLGMAAVVGKTVFPSVFDMRPGTPGWQGLIDLGSAVAAVRR